MKKEKIAFIPKQYFAAVAVLLAIMMSVLDGTIMNIALPTLAHDFDVTPATAIWIVNAYQIVITMTLLSFASLGDIYGYRRIFLIGISVFVGASVACILSNSFWTLTVSRIIQGFGAACIMSVNTALIRLIYPPQILGRGMGVNAMVVAVSAAAGPSIAGSILALGSWHWLFAINIPLGLAALAIGHRQRIDFRAADLHVRWLCPCREPEIHSRPGDTARYYRHLFHPPPTERNNPYPACGLAEDSYFRSFHRYLHHFVHRPDAGHGLPTVFHAERAGV